MNAVDGFHYATARCQSIQLHVCKQVWDEKKGKARDTDCKWHTAARNRLLYEVNEKVQFSEGKALATALRSDAPGAEEDEPARKSAK